jgi:hypothetical protein
MEITTISLAPINIKTTRHCFASGLFAQECRKKTGSKEHVYASFFKSFKSLTVSGTFPK